MHILSIHTLSIHTLSIHTPSMHTLFIYTLLMHTPSIHTLSMHTLSMHTLLMHILSILPLILLIVGQQPLLAINTSQLSEIGRLQKLPGYQRLRKQLIANLMTSPPGIWLGRSNIWLGRFDIWLGLFDIWLGSFDWAIFVFVGDTLPSYFLPTHFPLKTPSHHHTILYHTTTIHHQTPAIRTSGCCRAMWRKRLNAPVDPPKNLCLPLPPPLVRKTR